MLVVPPLTQEAAQNFGVTDVKKYKNLVLAFTQSGLIFVAFTFL